MSPDSRPRSTTSALTSASMRPSRSTFPLLLLSSLLLTFSSSLAEAAPPAAPEDLPQIKTGKFDFSECGRTKGCFKRCKDDDDEAQCYKYVSWKSLGDVIEFELSAATEGWVALGFSSDNRLGDDDAVVCQRVDPNMGDRTDELGRVAVLHVRNEDDVNTKLDQTSISDAKGEYHMKRVRCVFQRKRIPERQKEKILDLSNEKEPHLWIAVGPQMGDGDNLPKTQDSQHPLASTDPVDFTSGLDLGDHTQNVGRSWSPLLKAHVLTDLIAWVGFMSVYILLVAFYRGMWPNSSIRGEEVWLTWHRAFLYVTVILTIIGLLFWFLDLGWVWNWDYRHYPVLLIIVWVCVFLQPIILFFRPSNPEKNPCRNCIWEWIYLFPRAIGHICAVPAVFISFDLPRLLLPNYASWILFIFIIFFIIVQLILLILQCCTCKKNKERLRKWRKDLVDNPNLPRPQPVCHAFKSSLLWLYIFVLLVVLLVLSIIIIIW